MGAHSFETRSQRLQGPLSQRYEDKETHMYCISQVVAYPIGLISGRLKQILGEVV